MQACRQSAREEKVGEGARAGPGGMPDERVGVPAGRGMTPKAAKAAWARQRNGRDAVVDTGWSSGWPQPAPSADGDALLSSVFGDPLKFHPAHRAVVGPWPCRLRELLQLCPPPHHHRVHGSVMDHLPDHGICFAEPDGYYPPERPATFVDYTLRSGRQLRLRLVGHSPLWVCSDRFPLAPSHR